MVTFCLAWTTKRQARILHSSVAEYVKTHLLAACIYKGWKIESLSLRLDAVSLHVTVGPHVSALQAVTVLKHATSKDFFRDNPSLNKMPCLWTRSYFAASVGTVSDFQVVQHIEQERRKTKQAQRQAVRKSIPNKRQPNVTTSSDLGYWANVIIDKED